MLGRFRLVDRRKVDLHRSMRFRGIHDHEAVIRQKMVVDDDQFHQALSSLARKAC